MSNRIISTTKPSPYGLNFFSSHPLLLCLVSMIKENLRFYAFVNFCLIWVVFDPTFISPPQIKVRFHHPPQFAQFILSNGRSQSSTTSLHPPPPPRHSCHVCLSHSLHRRDPLSRSHPHACQPGCTSHPDACLPRVIK